MPVDTSTLREILVAAHQTVREANLPSALQPAAMEKAIEVLAAQAGLVATPQPLAVPASGAPTREPKENGNVPAVGGGTGSLESIASRLGVELNTVEQVFLAEDGFQIIVPTNRLPDRARPAMRDLIFLTALGRQAGGWDSKTTAVTDARAVCEHYGGRYYDPNNFANAVKDLDEYIQATGKRNDMTLRVLPGGYRAGAALVRRMAGEED
jgi:hypothetical protein